MSNRVNLDAVKFEYLDGNVYYGYTISDDYDMSFDNNAEAMIEDDIDLLKYAIKTADATTTDMIDHLKGAEKGLNINGSWYEWDKIKRIVEED